MLGYVARRIASLVPLLFVVSVLVYATVLLLPGDPARQIAGLQAPEEQVEEIRSELGLDDAFVVQYGRWVADAVTLDLGESIFSERSVRSEIVSRFPVTLSIAVGALTVSILLGFAFGTLAGTRPGSIVDRIVTFGTSAGVAVPDFWLAMVLVALFAVDNDLLPAIGYVSISDSPTDWAQHLLMPWLALGVSSGATTARQVRSSLIDVLQQDYIRTARAKGLSPVRVIGKHAMKNAALPVVTIIGLQFAYLLGGTVIIESIFSLPGLGTFMLQAVISRDLPVIQGVVLVVATIFVLANLVVDLVYGYVNPKVRLQR